MKTCIKIEIWKALHNKFFLISLGLMCLLALLSAISVIDNYRAALINFNRTCFEDGKMVANEFFPTWSSYLWWIGGESLSLVHSLFYILLPIFAVLPHGSSYLTELKSGYLRNMLIRTKKINYYTAKIISVFLSGSLIALLPLSFNFALVSAFIPSITPHANYVFYNNAEFGSLWCDLLFTAPLAYVFLYILLSGLFAGLIALLSLAVSAFIRNRFVVIFLPFLLMLGLDYLSGALTLAYEDIQWAAEISPISFLQSAQTRFDTIWWVVSLEAVLMAAISLTPMLIIAKGSKYEVF